MPARAQVRRGAFHRPPIQLDLPTPGRQQADDGAQQRGFAHPVMAENAHTLPGIKGERNAIDHADAPVAGNQILHRDHAATARPRYTSRTRGSANTTPASSSISTRP